MTTPFESSIGKAIERWLRDRGAWFVKTWGSAQRAGVPDYLGVLRGRFFAIEVKRPGKRPTKLQAVVLERIRRAGGIAIVARSVDDVDEVLGGEVLAL